MSMKPKTFRRLALATVLLVLAVGSVVAFVFVRQWQRERAAKAARVEGMALYERGELVRAASRLLIYLRSNFSDAEAWRVYGDCWERSELPDQKNIDMAKDAYSRVFDLDPADRASAIKLLKLYNRAGLYQEALTHAARLRPASLAKAGQEDFEVLREEAGARASLKLFDDRLREIADRMIALRPDDFNANAVKAGYLRENHRGEEAVAQVKSAAAQFPDHRGLKLLEALVTFQESGSTDTGQLFESACDAAGLDPKSGASKAALDSHDKELIFRLVGLFDSLSAYEHSESLLRAATAAPNADEEVLRLAIRRSWQLGKNSDVVSRLGAIDPAPGGDHSDLVAFKAMALRDLGKEGEARTLTEALKTRREYDYRANAWYLAFEAVPGMTAGPELPPVEGLQKLREAGKECPSEPAIAMLLGQSLHALGRAEEAFDAWKRATDSAPGWASPLIELSRACLEEGRTQDAFRAAEQALRSAPNSLASNVAFLNAQSALIESGQSTPGSPGDIERRLEQATRQVELLSDDRAKRSLLAGIIPARVVLAARAGRGDDARAIIRGAIDAPGDPDRALLRRLALISARETLGLEDECFARADAGASATPASVFSKAMAMHETDRTADGAALLRSSLGTAPSSERSAWARALAQYLDAVGDPAALEEWKSLCDANPGDLSLQLAALRAPSCARDSAFIERVTDRANKLSNADEEHPLAVARLARARALLAGPPSVKARDEAVSILRGLANEPGGDSYEIRSLLVAGLLMDDPARSIKPDTRSALDELRTMQRTAPDKAMVSLQIASILQRQHDLDHAREELRRVAEDTGAAPDLRLRAIDMLIAQADFAGAAAPMADTLGSLGARAEPARWLKLAAVYRALKQDAKAVEVFRRIAASSPTDADVIGQVADGLAASGQREEGDRAISRLDSLDLGPGLRELAYASYWSRRGEHSRAEGYYEKAIAAAPDSAGPWVKYAQYRASRSEMDRAAELVSRGLERVPDSPELRVVRQQIAVRRSEGDQFSMTDFAAALEADPSQKGRAEIIRAVEEMRRDGRLTEAKGIDELRSKYPDDMAVQTLASRLYANLKPPRLDLAAEAVMKTMAAFPTAVEPALLATQVFRERADWPEMLKAAQRWQQLTRSPESDLSVAEAHLNLNQAQQALDALRDRVADAASTHDSLVSVAILGLQARALATLGRAPEALEILRPLMKDSSAVRIRAAIPVAVLHVSSERDATQWLEAVETATPADDFEGRLALAGAWAAIGARAKPAREDLFDRAIACAKTVAGQPGAGAAPGHELIAQIQRQRGDTTGAAESFRRAIAADPGRVASLCGLADLLVSSGGETAEAVSLAERAVGASNPQDAGPRLLLARASAAHGAKLAAAGRAAESQAAFQRAADTYRALVAANPDDMPATLGLAHVSDSLGDTATSITSYERVLKSGGLSPATRAGIQNNLAYALLKSSKDVASLDRARTLASEAVSISEVGAFYDTLGSIELARADRGAAMSAFRRAIALDPSMDGSRIELASLLGASDQGKAEARALLDEAVKRGALSPAQKSRVEQVRAALDKPN